MRRIHLFSVRLLRGILWLILSITVFLAVIVTGLRFTLPHLNDYRSTVAAWLSEETDMAVDFSHLQGKWHFTGPSLVVDNVQFGRIFPPHSLVKVKQLQVEWNIWQSLLQGHLVLHNVRLDGVRLDLTQYSPNWWSKSQNTKPDHHLENRLNTLLLQQLQRFSITNSQVILTTPNNGIKTLFIPELYWQNRNFEHRVQGVIQVADSPQDKVTLMANLSEPNGQLSHLQGKVYLNGKNISLRPWLAPWIAKSVDIQQAQTSFQAWINLSSGTLGQSLLSLEQGQLRWQREKVKNTLQWHQGLVQLTPMDHHEKWQIDVQQMALSSNGQPWPIWSAMGHWSPASWQGNLSSLSLRSLRPLLSLMPISQTNLNNINEISPRGQLKNLHFSSQQKESPIFSVEFTDGGLNHWRWLPEMHRLSGKISGSINQGTMDLMLNHDTLPYGEFFARPLIIKNSRVQIHWQKQNHNWRIIVPHLSLLTPDLSLKGQLGLTIFPNTSPFLSLMTQVSVHRVSQVWRYLPRAAMSNKLANYLSQALQGGEVKNGHILWYGKLGDFPYHDGNGIFEASVPLQQGTFQFSPLWPAVKDLQLTALFENDKMFLHGTHGVTEGAVTRLIQGQAVLSPTGTLALAIDIQAKNGELVRRYMNKTPLKSSVGKTLEQIKISDPISAQLHLMIPFSKGKIQSWGTVSLPDNTVSLQTPPMTLTQARGQLNFHDDKIKISQLQANWLQQPVRLDLTGGVQRKNYHLNIGLSGDWTPTMLPFPKVHSLKSEIQGKLPWQASMNISFIPNNVIYQGNVALLMNGISTTLPYPFALSVGNHQRWQVSVNGNKFGLNGTLSSPNLLYQTQLDFRSGTPKITNMDLQFGRNLTPYAWPLTQSRVAIQCDKLNLDRWFQIASQWWSNSSVKTSSVALPKARGFVIPMPSEIVAQIGQLKLGDLWWHGVSISAYEQAHLWQAFFSSKETQGTVTWRPNTQLDIDLQTAHFSLPPLRQWSLNDSVHRVGTDDDQATWINAFDRKVFQAIPSINLNMKDVWVQGRQVGSINGVLRRENHNLTLDHLNVVSKDAKLSLSGQWQLAGAKNYTHFRLHLQGKNSSRLMAMFGVKGGIHDSPFDTNLALSWAGTPWAIVRNSVNGTLNTELGEGVISGVGNGATRLLGFFSLDSLIRRLKLDFSDLSDDGFAFDRIKGSAIVQNGIVSTHDVTMKSPVGDLNLTGDINLNTEKINAKAVFVPDLASGLPTLVAFAVAPQSALYVLAASTLLAPFIDVFTQIHYAIEGNMFAPTVHELSRYKGRYQMPNILEEKKAHPGALYH
jgi:uncharacterized protein (TIGR02099 family)